MRGPAAAAAILALCAAAHAWAASADPDPPASDAAEALVQWLDTNVDSGDWEIADLSRNEALYVRRPGEVGGPAAVIRVSARWERFARPTADRPWRSALQALEIDCAGRRFRELEWTAYAGSNLMGEVVDRSASPDEPWRPAVDGSIMVSAVERSCRVPDAKPQGEAGDKPPSR